MLILRNCSLTFVVSCSCLSEDWVSPVEVELDVMEADGAADTELRSAVVLVVADDMDELEDDC